MSATGVVGYSWQVDFYCMLFPLSPFNLINLCFPQAIITVYHICKNLLKQVNNYICYKIVRHSRANPFATDEPVAHTHAHPKWLLLIYISRFKYCTKIHYYPDLIQIDPVLFAAVAPG